MRKAEVKRKTNETDIEITLDIDGNSRISVNSGILFFDQMLTSFAKHSNIDFELKAKGDTDVDFHHTIEDTGIAS